MKNVSYGVCKKKSIHFEYIAEHLLAYEHKRTIYKWTICKYLKLVSTSVDTGSLQLLTNFIEVTSELLHWYLPPPPPPPHTHTHTSVVSRPPPPPPPHTHTQTDNTHNTHNDVIRSLPYGASAWDAPEPTSFNGTFRHIGNIAENSFCKLLSCRASGQLHRSKQYNQSILYTFVHWSVSPFIDRLSSGYLILILSKRLFRI